MRSHDGERRVVQSAVARQEARLAQRESKFPFVRMAMSEPK
ncbi:MAG: hypothetical protein ACREJB_13600 [Planctomycetaceae bacterium]